MLRHQKEIKVLKRPTLLKPEASYWSGVPICIGAGALGGIIVWLTLAFTLDFGYLDVIVAPIAGFAVGVATAIALFTNGRLHRVKVNQQGRGTLFGRLLPFGPGFDEGYHWRPIFCGIWVVPGPNHLLAMDLPGAEFNAKDNSRMFVGMHKDPEANKPNRIEFWIVQALPMIRVRSIKEELRTEFLSLARLFFGEMEQAVAAKSDLSLVMDFLELPPETDDGAAEKHEKFKKNRLRTALYEPGNKNEDGTKIVKNIFSDESVERIMKRAGEFKEYAEQWGVEIRQVYIQNVRLNEEIEEAADEFAATTARMQTADLEIETITKGTAGLRREKVSPDLATLIATARVDPKAAPDLRNITYNLPQIDKAAEALGGGLAEAVKSLADVIRRVKEAK